MPARPHLSERELTRALRAQGFGISSTRKGTRVHAPNGGGTASWHPSAFDEGNVRTYQNMLSQLIRIGFDLKEAVDPRRERVLVAANGGIEQPAIPESPEVAAQGEADHMEADTLTDQQAKIGNLPPGPLALYEAILGDPGQYPRVYQERVGFKKSLMHSYAITLLGQGLIERTGKTQGVRYWIPGQEKAKLLGPVTRKAPKRTTRRSSGPIRVRQQEPADPRVAFAKLVELAQGQAVGLAATLDQMTAMYASVTDELDACRTRQQKLDDVLGKAVDLL